ncbi:MAG TPA: phosphoribosylaminoimidazolesuccinocarboxamide synthase [Caldisericia bacterium]|nr:phosphoribosylaminoimidazolesuccinocarboxamide synthase [Caldisericia bacterium]HPF48637.1 phosphoribosylaminoimidazolesuccinocarboxamide synthase [Caldisericia bacterium]HPI83703.1 phosphoribosylaminoimidazolesuccinocarboxamide synthase [Caldisericia bacterium]HPQ93092.1 phosphoribosylaminoimidazolesuccinocarboxamide synthase [Caldisericia bacterium]HRV75075.1 phosphoribosylaminoimidazolesuccinocarboxamide synthase [Caldisericia bacterium]
METLYEGKAKILYKTDDPDVLIAKFKNDLTAFDGTKHGTMASKGEINAKISSVIMKYLASHGVPNHFIELVPPDSHKVKSCKILPIEVIIRNYLAGSICKRFGLEEGKKLDEPLIEFCYKNDELHDPFICKNHAILFGWATPAQLARIEELAFSINMHMTNFWKEVGLTLVDFKLEFGLHKGEVILADEWTPDTCRLWDVKTGEKMDKDRFRRDLGGVLEAYEEVARRITGA